MAAQTGIFHTGEPSARGAESFHGRKGGAVSPPVPGTHRPVPGAMEKRDYRQVRLRPGVRQRQICRTANLHSEAALRARARNGPSEWRAGVCEKPRIKCAECGNRSLIAISGAIIYSHLAGEKTIGVYPLLPDDTCHFLAVDVDKDEWREDAQAFARLCHELDIPVALEVSRSGNGANAWIFFTAEVPARDPDPGYPGGRCNSMPAGCNARARSPCAPMRSRTCHPLKWTLNSFAIHASACTSPAPCLPAACAYRHAPWKTGSKGGHGPMPRPLH